MTEQKTLTLDFKADDSGQISGYGSIFGNVDDGGDVVAKGAFTDSLASGRRVKMLWQHDPSRPIGVWENVAEDDAGLKVSGRILVNTAGGKDAYELVKSGAIDGLSIGYRTLESKGVDGNRVITKADIWEVSLVTFPMNTGATITAFKSGEITKQELERRLTQDAKLSRSAARALMRDGFKGVSMPSAGDDLEELARLIVVRALAKRHLI